MHKSLHFLIKCTPVSSYVGVKYKADFIAVTIKDAEIVAMCGALNPIRVTLQFICYICYNFVDRETLKYKLHIHVGSPVTGYVMRPLTCHSLIRLHAFRLRMPGLSRFYVGFGLCCAAVGYSYAK